MEKKYLISFYASIKGNKMVVSGLTKMEAKTKKFGKTADKTKGKTQDFGSALSNIAKRALLTIPVWLLLRTVFMAITRTISDVINAYIELDDGLARIRTVVSASSDSVEADMIAIRRQILKVAVDTRISIKELAEAFYYLRTASLTTEEAMSAFEPTINAMVGTMNNAKDTARAVAGMYNTMGKYMEENLTAHEKFTKIADILTYTYATQDVQLDELISGYTKLAPYLAGLDDSFEDIVTTLGFLNTRMLRAGRTGRLTGRAILQITKNARKLAKIFGITFDPDKPISLLNTLGKIADMMKTGEKLTFKQGQALQEVFATRGGVAVRLLIQHFDELREAIGLAGENAEGFAKRMRNIREATIKAQLERMRNIIQIIGNEFVTGAMGAGDLIEALQKLNTNLEWLIVRARALGEQFAYLNWIWEKLSEPKEIAIAFREQDYIKALRLLQDTLSEGGMDVRLREFYRESIEHEQKLTRERAKQQKVREIDRKQEEERRQTELHSQREINEKLRHGVSLLKLKGANQVDITKYKLEYLESLYEETENLKEIDEIERARNEYLEARIKYRNELVNVFQKAELNMLKAMGGSQIQLLQLQEKHLQISRENMTNEQYMLELSKLRTQQATALEQLRRRELDLATNLYEIYHKANESEKSRIRRMMELREFDPDKLARTYKENMYDQKVIDDYFRYFSTKQKDAITEARQKIYDLPDIEIDTEPIETPFFAIETLLPQDKIADYWRTWEEIGKGSADRWIDYLIESLRGRLSVEDYVEGLKPEEVGKTSEQLIEEVAQAEEFYKRQYEQFAKTMEGMAEKVIYESYRMIEKIAPGQLPQYRPAGAGEPQLPKATPEIKPTIEKIEINIPEAVEEIADKVSKDVKEELLTNEEFAKKWLRRFRGYV